MAGALPLIQRHNFTYSFICKSFIEHVCVPGTTPRVVQGKWNLGR